MRRTSFHEIAALRALSHRNFRVFVGGQGLSVIGTWVQRIALVWLVYRLTESSLILGIVGFAGQIPLLVVTPFGGVLADRWNKHKILLYTQILSMLQAFALAALVLTDNIFVWEIIVLSILIGVLDALDMPARQSFMMQMIRNDRESLPNAVAMNSVLVNAARLVGPGIAGVLISMVAVSLKNKLNALSLLAAIPSLLVMDVPPEPPPVNKPKAPLEELGEGMRYAFGFAPIRAMLLLLGMVSLFATPIRVLAPAFVDRILHSDAGTFGLLMGISGMGALASAVYLMVRKGVLGLGKLVGLSSAVMGVALLGFAFSRWLAVAAVFIAFVGAGQMICLAGTNTLLQTMVEDEKRGRVMSLYAMSFRGIMPFSSLLAGAAGDWIGVPWTLAICGAGSIAGSCYFLMHLPRLRHLVRPIYVRLGILPESILGVSTATRLTSQEPE
ncbi:MAG: MFS transporter [Candidatus Omnitrophica bacterium]|nr:MFS transporter [Candidatus Omnitrophota bacterium]